ncbi:MAG TPA: phosphotransferase family protein [Myxococcales bacterium]|nr:phosphotransferase family protein [Myxococcales bacterium]HIK84762.1 phosphotransferase family protein [Myxococcales bacterium]
MMKGIQLDRLEAYFAEHVEGAVPPLQFSLITGGRSNLTFLVEDAQGKKRVLRRPPLGAVLATAHDMSREYRILSALTDSDVPVPRTLALCQDEAVNDAPFYVMDYVEGDVLVGPEMTAELVPEENRHALGMNAIEILANLHRIEPDDVGLGDLGRREAYLARQLKRWSTQWEKSKTRDLPEMEEAHAVLESKMPEQLGSVIVHGDFRLGNFLSTGAKGRIEAVLDWELCTLGDPLADVGYLMNDWNGPGDDRPTASGTGLSSTSCGGFPSREAILERYEELTGFSTKGVDYYRAFQYWRLAAIVEGVLSRYKQGVMGDQVDITQYQTQVTTLAKAALALVRSNDFS